LPADRAVPSVDWAEATQHMGVNDGDSDSDSLSLVNFPVGVAFSQVLCRKVKDFMISLHSKLDGKERAQYLSTTRAMETKFAQLIKLRRLLQAREELFSIPLLFLCLKSGSMNIALK